MSAKRSEPDNSKIHQEGLGDIARVEEDIALLDPGEETHEGLENNAATQNLANALLEVDNLLANL